MNETLNELKRELGRYIHRTYKNKLCAIGLFILGTLSVFIDYDPTFLIFTMMVGLPLFFTRRKVVY